MKLIWNLCLEIRILKLLPRSVKKSISASLLSTTNVFDILLPHLPGANELIFYVLIFSEGTKTYLHFMSFLHIDMAQLVGILSSVRQGLQILYYQHHGRWCPGAARSQGISNHDIDLIKPRLLGPRKLRVKLSYG